MGALHDRLEVARDGEEGVDRIGDVDALLLGVAVEDACRDGLLEGSVALHVRGDAVGEVLDRDELRVIPRAPDGGVLRQRLHDGPVAVAVGPERFDLNPVRRLAGNAGRSGWHLEVHAVRNDPLVGEEPGRGDAPSVSVLVGGTAAVARNNA